jgi:hypothetical protein
LSSSNNLKKDIPDFNAKEDESSGNEFSDDDVDLFSAPMNSEAFMAKIAA